MKFMLVVIMEYYSIVNNKYKLNTSGSPKTIFSNTIISNEDYELIK